MPEISPSGTNQPTGSEPQYSGNANDNMQALLGRVKSFVAKAAAELVELSHLPAVSSAAKHLEDALLHIAEGQPVAAAADAAQVATDVTTAVQQDKAEDAAAQGDGQNHAQQESEQPGAQAQQ